MVQQTEGNRIFLIPNLIRIFLNRLPCVYVDHGMIIQSPRNSGRGTLEFTGNVFN